MQNRSTVAANFNRHSLDAVLSGFRDVRNAFITRLETLTAEEVGRAAHHPRLEQPMRILDLMVFAAEHDDHHLVRITELLRRFA
jgi:hypothetical protein